mmetsp:Transcript_11999/g.39795  ORF Transcript_11999/g.39795 Transcript_11999/m.39795 type:complete len:311 (+) Transcript_11999:620-1552(+)
MQRELAHVALQPVGTAAGGPRRAVCVVVRAVHRRRAAVQRDLWSPRVVVGAPPLQRAHRLWHAAAQLRDPVPRRVLRADHPLVDVRLPLVLPRQPVPAVRGVLCARPHVGVGGEPRVLVVQREEAVHLRARQLGLWLDKEGHAVRQVPPLSVVEVRGRVEARRVGHGAEDGPHARLAEASALKGHRVVHVREGEGGVVRLAVEVAVRDGKADDVRRHQAGLLVVARQEPRDARLVGVRHDVPLRHAQRHPECALLNPALADQLHVPRLAGRRVGEREALHVTRVAVRCGERVHHLDRLAGSGRALQRDVD